MIFSTTIIKWYHKNKRDLPWRNTKDPYRIWISEIILQQTKVSQGLPYYNRFIKKFPTITELAKASEDEVLNLWQGLGYYSRARNLHVTAKLIRDEYDSVFPSDYKSIKNLKGIGDYTAAAISSFCYKLPYAVLDGNVSRVLSRYFAIETPIDVSEGQKVFKKLSQELLDLDNPDTYNQAIMEFGALQCVPKSPNCEDCPLHESCQSYSTELVQLLPLKSKSLKVIDRYFNYLIITSSDNTFIHKREEGIWKSLYQFPLIEGNLDFEVLQKSKEWDKLFKGKDVVLNSSSLQIKHKLSHQLIHAVFYSLRVEDFSSDNLIKLKWKNLDDYPLPRLIDKYLKSIK
ncbi:MAG: A/G-specific adenine glycosylase [Flavobacteriales bacterium]|nr:A/G-specific adenine glycosylase [Flavobacteriales bacterium]|tara:strand:+ start:7761 stop:8792 length:1032 start_codon:yes stop_codon:yes gene_type:complete